MLPRPGSSAPRSSLPADTGFMTAQNTSVCACVCEREKERGRDGGGGGVREAGQKNQGRRGKKEVLTRVYPHTALAPSHKYPSSLPPPPPGFFFFWRDVSWFACCSFAHDISFLGAGSLPWSWKQWKRGNRTHLGARSGVGIRASARPGEWDQVLAVGLRFCWAQFFSGVLLGARVGVRHAP